MTVDKSPDRVRRMFDEIAPRYDFLNRLLSLGIDRSWRKKAVKAVYQNLPEGPILDVCTGTGDLLIEYFRQNPARSLAGIDFSQEMIARAAKKVERAKANHQIELHIGDAMNLPFNDDHFAAVSIAFGLRNVCDTDKGLAEMVRVCKPGGIVAVLDFSIPRVPILSSIYRIYFRTLLPRIGQFFAKNRESAYHYFPQSVLEFDSINLAERMLLRRVTNIQTISMTFGIAYLHYGKK